jgi:NAD/NADP transhydrogenase alpha subunit
MIVKRIVKSEEGLEATLMMTPEQAAFFMGLGLNLLVQRGAATVVDYTEEEFQAELEKLKEEGLVEAGIEAQPATTVTNEQEQAEQKEFLESVDEKTLHQA